MVEDKGHFSLDRSTKWSKKTKSLLHSHRSPGRLGKTIHLNGSFVRRRIFCVLLLVVVPIYLFYSRQVARFYKPFFCAYIRSFWLRRPFSVVDAHAFEHYIRRYYSSYVNDFISLQRMLRFSVTLLIRKKMPLFTNFLRFAFFPLFVSSVLLWLLLYRRASFFGTHVGIPLCYICLICVRYDDQSFQRLWHFQFFPSSLVLSIVCTMRRCYRRFSFLMFVPLNNSGRIEVFCAFSFNIFRANHHSKCPTQHTHTDTTLILV